MLTLAEACVVSLAMAAVTLFTRAAPFVLFGRRKPPEFMPFLERFLPPAVMTILVIYCLKSVRWEAAPHGLPELVAVVVVAVLHLWRRNALLSILGGTALYMAMVQTAIFG